MATAPATPAPTPQGEDLVCTNCKQVLAKVVVLIPFGASVVCGECGATVGHRMIPPAAAEPEAKPADAPAPSGTAAA